jgi:hypothetical protein
MKALGPHDLHKMLDGFEDKSVQAVATFAYSEGPGHEPILFQGRTDVCQSYDPPVHPRFIAKASARASLCRQEGRQSLVSICLKHICIVDR